VVKPPLRTKTLGTKVSEEEFAQLEASGQRAWADAERVVPGNAAGQRERPGGEIRRFRRRADHALMAELVALPHDPAERALQAGERRRRLETCVV